MTTDAPDPLEQVVRNEERRDCLHPHVHFQYNGGRLRCVDCRAFWNIGWVDQNGFETPMTDYMYMNPKLHEGEFRHSPNETPRQKPLSK